MSLVRISLGEVLVGTIERFEDELNTHTFRWDADYLLTPERPILGQYMEDRLGGPVETHGLTPWFEHLLPQGALRGAIARDARVELSDGLGLLVWLGADLPGAVRVDVLRALRPLRARPGHAVVPAPPTATLRASLPGVQWKLSLLGTEKGLTLPLRGRDGDWIAKFHAEAFPRIVPIEHATMDWAALVGVEVPQHRIVRCDDIQGLPDDVPRGDGAVYAIERFDRVPNGRVHVEDFGQVLDRPPGPDQYRGAYEEIGAVLAALCPEDAREFVRRVVFCCVVGNGDAHLKNWALRYADGRHPRLSPAYDLVPTVVYRGVDYELALTLGGSKRYAPMTLDRFDGLARAVGISRDEMRVWVSEDAARTRDVWRTSAVRDAFTEGGRARIERHLAAVAIP